MLNQIKPLSRSSKREGGFFFVCAYCICRAATTYITTPILPRGSSRSRHHSLLHPWRPSLSRGGCVLLRKSTKNLHLSFLRVGVLRSRKRRLCVGAINVAFLVRSFVHPFPLKIRRQNLRLLYFYIPVAHPSTSGWVCTRHRVHYNT